MPESEEIAEETLRKFEDAARNIRGDEDVSDNVVQHMLMDKTSLEDEKWLGTEEEELNAYVMITHSLTRVNTYYSSSYVSELLYIHSKLMIVDDRRVIVSSIDEILGLKTYLTVVDGLCQYKRS